MLRYALGRIALLPVTLVGVLTLCFALLGLAPGGPGDAREADADARAGGAGREAERAFRRHFGLDRPLLVDTRRWLDGDALAAALRCRRDPTCAPAARLEATRLLDDGGDAIVRGLAAALDVPDVADDAARALGATLGVAPSGGSTRALDRAALRRAAEAPRFAPSVAAALTNTRVGRWFEALARLDLGVSAVDRRPVVDKLAHHLPYTLALTALGLLVALLGGVGLGFVAAYAEGHSVDRALRGAALLLQSAPSFFVGTALLALLSQGTPVRWFPTGGVFAVDAPDRTLLADLRDAAWHLVLPVATYAAGVGALVFRHARSGLADALASDPIRAARARGVPEVLVLGRHAARLGLVPVVTLLASFFPALVSGSVVVEVVFGIPGLGTLLYESVGARDYDVVMGVLLLVAVATLVGVLVSDLLHAAIDPRVTFEAQP
jgi:peptide/nickel transport system permease protein